MTWILLACGLCLAGLAVLGVAFARVVAAARDLSREVAQVHEQFGDKQDAKG
ncbi:hypothetical protein [Nonomuraea longispora]|uniref:hypothetical protein n=1 Tax=Nonomuraea longispora TaxID=1848320 RepID=UPI001405412C|nr:hypothetical protein [Nonomuraea longispora]